MRDPLKCFVQHTFVSAFLLDSHNCNCTSYILVAESEKKLLAYRVFDFNVQIITGIKVVPNACCVSKHLKGHGTLVSDEKCLSVCHKK